MALSFAFDPSKGETAATLAKRRRVLEALYSRTASHAPRNVGEGLSALGGALGFRLGMNRLEAGEEAGERSADGAMNCSACRHVQRACRQWGGRGPFCPAARV